MTNAPMRRSIKKGQKGGQPTLLVETHWAPSSQLKVSPFKHVLSWHPSFLLWLPKQESMLWWELQTSKLSLGNQVE